MTHCSRPASVQYLGEPTEQMRIDPETGGRLNLCRKQLLTLLHRPGGLRPYARRSATERPRLKTSSERSVSKTRSDDRSPEPTRRPNPEVARRAVDRR